MFGPWMTAQRNPRRSRNSRGVNQNSQSGFNNHGAKKEGERSQQRNKTGGGNRFNAIADFMEEDSTNFDEVMEGECHAAVNKEKVVAGNLNNDLEGPTVAQ